jgi:hypothetical protein
MANLKIIFMCVGVSILASSATVAIIRVSDAAKTEAASAQHNRNLLSDFHKCLGPSLNNDSLIYCFNNHLAGQEIR